MPSSLVTPLAAGLIAFAIPAQSMPYDTALVVAATASAPATVILEVDLQTGSFTALPGFASDSYPPLAIVSDPIDGSVLVALDTGSATRVMRRRWLPTASESLVGTVSGRAVELLVDRFGDIVVVIGGSTGGLHRLPREGGSAGLIRAVPNVGAAGSPQLLHWHAILGISGTTAPTNDPKLGNLDLDGASWNWGPITMMGFQPHGIVGLLDLATAVPRQVLAHDDGSLSVYDWSLGGNPIPATTTPPLPSGGVAAMRAHEQQIGLLLGGAANPQIYAFDPITALSGSITLTVIAGPLIGSPIDYTVLPLAGASVQNFGRPCGIAAELRIAPAVGGGPMLGNSTFGLRLRQALPGLPAWLVLGFGETTFPMPTGCQLQVTLDAVGARWTNGSGEATLPIPLPNDPGLVGVRFFGQWLQVDGLLPFMASDLAVVEIGL